MVAFRSKPILSPGSICHLVSGIVVYCKYVIYEELLHIMSYTLHTYNVLYFTYDNSPYMTYLGIIWAGRSCCYG